MGSPAVKRLLLLVLTTSSCLAPAGAQAAVTATLSSGVFTVTSDNAGNVNESFTLRDAGANVGVTTSPAIASDPDGGGSDCVVSGGEALCRRDAVDLVRVLAGNGQDTIVDNRGTGPSTLEGGSGNDTITTTTAGTAAALLGQAGQDALTAADADDRLSGGDDGDTLTAVGAKALVPADDGGAGNDTFVGNPEQSDFLSAEAGADIYTLGTHAAAPGEAGTDPTLLQRGYEDAVDYSALAGPVAVRLDGVANDGHPGEQDDVRGDVERVIGTEAADLLQAGALGVRLSGLGGADQLLGGPGPDRLEGGGGGDVLRGGDGDDELDDGDFTPAVTDSPLPPAGNDVLDGGPGADTLRADRGADDLSGGPGIDTATFDRPVPQPSSVTTPVRPAGFTVSLDDVANDGQTGTGEGDDVRTDVERLVTTGGDDVVTGSAGADDIATGGGSDTVTPGNGLDVVDLGAGDDHVRAVDQTADVLRCGAGADTADVDLPGGQPARADVLFDCETVTGTPLPALPGPIAVPPVGLPPGGAPPAKDTTRPRLTLGGAKTIKAKAFLATPRLRLTVRCSEACTASARASISRGGGRSLLVGSGSLKRGTGTRTLRVTIAANRRATVRAKLRTKAQRRKGLKVRVRVTVADAAGNRATGEVSVVVKG